MKKTNQLSVQFSGALLFTIAALLLSCALPAALIAQNYRIANPETATCQVSLATEVTESGGAKYTGKNKGSNKTKQVIKTHQPALNRLGYFNQVANVQPQQKVLIEVAYPNATAGSKIAVAVADGGTLEHKQKANVVQLNSQKKVSFHFYTATDPGIYRIMLRKGNDTKVVQLWVGVPPQPVSK